VSDTFFGKPNGWVENPGPCQIAELALRDLKRVSSTGNGYGSSGHVAQCAADVIRCRTTTVYRRRSIGSVDKNHGIAAEAASVWCRRKHCRHTCDSGVNRVAASFKDALPDFHYGEIRGG
jgi:hypothetical protein